MLRISFACLCMAVALGCWLEILYLQPNAARPGWILRAVHGLAGASGLGLLLAAAWGPSGGQIFAVTGGVARSGLILIAAALVLGLLFLLGWKWLGKMRNSVLILHACVAITGFVLLSGWYLNG